MGFSDQRSALYAAYTAGNHAEALRLADAVHREYPAHHAETWLWRACLLGALGRAEEALATLEAGLVDGAWWSPHTLEGERDLEAARALPGFAGVRIRCEELLARARRTARPECLVLAPATAVWDPRSVLFLHWRGDSARGFAETWQPLVDQGWTLVVPQSSQPFDSESFCWDDAEVALGEIRQHLEDCRTKRRLPVDGIVMAGASQGAPLAIQIAADAGLPWLCVIPMFPKGFDVSRLCAVPRHTRGAVILGERDPANARANALISELKDAGVSLTVRTVKGIGHEMTTEMVGRAGDALRELAGAQVEGEPLSEAW